MPAYNETELLEQSVKEVVGCTAGARPGLRGDRGRERLHATTLADARRASRRATTTVEVLTRPRSPTTAPRCAPGSSPPRARSSCSTSTTTTSGSSTEVAPARSRPDGDPAIVVGSKRAPGARDTRPWPRRLVTAGFSAVLRLRLRPPVRDTHGMKAMRRETVEPLARALPQRHRSLRHRADPAGRPRRSAGRGAAGGGGGASSVALADLAPGPAHAVGAGPPPASSSGGGSPADAAALRRRALRASRRRRTRSARSRARSSSSSTATIPTSSCASPRRTSSGTSTTSRSRCATSSPAGHDRHDRDRGASAARTKSRTALGSRRSRRRSPTRELTPVALTAEAHARRHHGRRAGPTATSTVDRCSCSRTRSPSPPTRSSNG